jgi:hypothetical protein
MLNHNNIIALAYYINYRSIRKEAHMNYEIFYGEYESVSNQLKDRLASQQRLLKRAEKSIEKGDLRSAIRDLSAIHDTTSDYGQLAEELLRKTESLDMTEYLDSGEFARQLVESCKLRGVDIVGEENNYEVFPYRLKIDSQNAELLINGKKASGLRPLAIAETLEKNREKLLSASFNAELYAAELAAAYDLAIVASAKGKTPVLDADMYLATLYKFLTPMRRFRREYDMQSYAFDLARLYNAESITIGDGRKYQFGPSRNNKKAIRIVDRFGNEQFIAMIRFYHE